MMNIVEERWEGYSTDTHDTVVDTYLIW